MKRINLVVAAILIGLAVALTYFCFEWLVRVAIDTVWNDFLHVDEHKWRVVPVCVALTVLYFGAVHVFDRKSEPGEAGALGKVPQPTMRNLVLVLGIGLLSLLAGASLGPEAILVPACVVIGGIIGQKLRSSDSRLMGALGFIGLLAAFFNSFIVGMLGILLVGKQFGLKLSARLIILSILACLSVVGLLHVLEGESYVAGVGNVWSVQWPGLLWLAVVAIACYLLVYVLHLLSSVSLAVLKSTRNMQWWQKALIAGGGLSLLYFVASPLIWFTGNESVRPLIAESAVLGVSGLVIICITKLAAMAWSKVSGYRGGLIFPLVLVIVAVVSTAHLYTDSFGVAIGLVVGMVGALVADHKLKVLL